jgi:hypothetical protein
MFFVPREAHCAPVRDWMVSGRRERSCVMHRVETFSLDAESGCKPISDMAGNVQATELALVQCFCSRSVFTSAVEEQATDSHVMAPTGE